MSAGTRQKLCGARTDSDYNEDKFYVIESILEIKGKGKKKSYKVKWAGYSETTIEDDDHLPGFITKFYSDNPDKLGSKLSNPKIKATQNIGSSEVHLLSWDDEGLVGTGWMKIFLSITMRMEMSSTVRNMFLATHISHVTKLQRRITLLEFLLGRFLVEPFLCLTSCMAVKVHSRSTA